MDKYILSYGGGVNSSAMLFQLWEQKRPIDLVLFADTGEEELYTYDAVARMKAECLKRGVEFITVKSNLGNLYDYYYSKKAVPSVKFRDCTSKFKISPIRKYIRTRYGKQQQFKLYIGIASDEFHRMRTSDVKYIENLYPLVDDDVSREGCFTILNKYSFKAEKSGCKGCPFRPKAEWLEMATNNIKEFERWERLERNGSRYPSITLIPNVKLLRFREAKDQKKLGDFTPPLPCDVAGGCFL